MLRVPCNTAVFYRLSCKLERRKEVFGELVIVIMEPQKSLDLSDSHRDSLRQTGHGLILSGIAPQFGWRRKGQWPVATAGLGVAREQSLPPAATVRLLILLTIANTP